MHRAISNRLNLLHQQNVVSQRDPVSEQKTCYLETTTNIEPLKLERFLSSDANVVVTAFDSDGYSNTAALPAMNQTRGIVQPPPVPVVSAMPTEETTFSLVSVSPAPAEATVTLLKADTNHLQLGVEPPGMGHLTIAVKKTRADVIGTTHDRNSNGPPSSLRIWR